MRVSTIVVLIAVAGVPASCKKKPTPEFTPEQIHDINIVGETWETTKHANPAYMSFASVFNSVHATVTDYGLPPIRTGDSLEEQASKGFKHIYKAFETALPADAKSYWVALESESWSLRSSLTKSVLEKAATATYTPSTRAKKPWDTLSTTSDVDTIMPRALKHKHKPKTSESRTTSLNPSFTLPVSNLAPQQQLDFLEAWVSFMSSKYDSPAWTSYQLDSSSAMLKLPMSVQQELEYVMTASVTDPSASARKNNAEAKLPSVVQNGLKSQNSEYAAFESSFSNSIFGSTVIATSSSGNKIGAATITRRAAPEETYSFTSSDDDKSESSPDDSNMTAQEESEFQLAQTQYNALIMSLEYESMKERLKEEPSDLPDADDFWDPERSQKGKFDARLKRFLKPFPSYAKTLISSEIALQNKMHTMTQLVATRTKASASPASTLSKRQAGPFVDDQAYTKTIVDVFTVTSMTPEQSAEGNRKMADYFQTFGYPAIASIWSKFGTKGLQRTAPAHPAAHTPLPVGAGKSAIVAWISSEVNLYPKSARPLFRSALYGIFSIQSEVMNAGSTSDMSVSTPASPQATSEGPATSPGSASTSATLSSKTHTTNTKSSKKKGTITPRAILPRETANVEKHWTPKQISALEDGLDSLLSSLDTDTTAISLASKYSTYFTAPVWTQLQRAISSIASSRTQVPSLCKAAEVSSALAGLPADGASFLCRYWDAEASLFSSVDKMRGPTTKPTTLKTKTKREEEYTDPVYGTKTPDPYTNSAEFESWFDRYFSAIYEITDDGDLSTASPSTRTVEYLTTTSINGHLEFVTVRFVVVPGTPAATSSSKTASSKPTSSKLTSILDTNEKSAAMPESRIHSITSVTTANVEDEFTTSSSSKADRIMSTTTPSSHDRPSASSSTKTDSIESARTADFENGLAKILSSKVDSTATNTANFDDEFATSLSITATSTPSFEEEPPTSLLSTATSTASFDDGSPTSLSSNADSTVSATPDDFNTKFSVAQPSMESTVSAESKVAAESKLSSESESAVSTASVVNKQVTSATKLVAASPTHHSSASSRGILTAGVVGVCLIGVMALL